MALKLNATPETYKIFYGNNLIRMPPLMAEGRVPINVTQLMQIRLDYRNGPQDVKSFWMTNYFDTGDAVVYNPNGDVKVVLDSQTLREMNSQSTLRKMALLLTEDVYKALEGEVFKKGKLGKVNASLTRAETKAQPIWQVLARDKSLLADYVDFIFAKGKESYNYDELMGVYPSSCSGDQPEMRSLCVSGLYDGSVLSGRSDVDFDGGQLVGRYK
jgi:hypothetical protein